MKRFKKALKLVKDCKVIDYNILFEALAHEPVGRFDKEEELIFKLCEWKQNRINNI